MKRVAIIELRSGKLIGRGEVVGKVRDGAWINVCTDDGHTETYNLLNVFDEEKADEILTITQTLAAERKALEDRHQIAHQRMVSHFQSWRIA